MEMSSLGCTYLRDSDQGPFSYCFDLSLMGTLPVGGASMWITSDSNYMEAPPQKAASVAIYFHLKDEKEKQDFSQALVFHLNSRFLSTRQLFLPRIKNIRFDFLFSTLVLL